MNAYSENIGFPYSAVVSNFGEKGWFTELHITWFVKANKNRDEDDLAKKILF